MPASADNKTNCVASSCPATYTPNSTAAGRNWRRRPHSSCRLDSQCSGDRDENRKGQEDCRDRAPSPLPPTSLPSSFFRIRPLRCRSHPCLTIALPGLTLSPSPSTPPANPGFIRSRGCSWPRPDSIGRTFCISAHPPANNV